MPVKRVVRLPVIGLTYLHNTTVTGAGAVGWATEGRAIYLQTTLAALDFGLTSNALASFKLDFVKHRKVVFFH